MPNLAIRVEGLGKRYRIGAATKRITTAREAIAHFATAPVRNLGRLRRLTAFREEDEADVIWALRDVSFELAHGEALGIIGQNGAGKSTLLKVLSRITRQTTGRLELYGRVGSLLEVGTGFHPELTGRDNISLNGSILGMDRSYIKRRFAEIVEFAGVEKFIDTPVKRYSSGMYVRLAFAVAAHLEPEILIVDEVLAVGDADFQQKCLGKMGDVAKEGRTVLFVSHNLAAIQKLCSRVLWLRGGMICGQGAPPEVISQYVRATFSEKTEWISPDISAAPGNEQVRLHSARVRPIHGLPSDPITIRTPFILEFEYWDLRGSGDLALAIHLYNQENIMILGSQAGAEQLWQSPAAGLIRSTCYVPGDLLNDGVHHVELLVAAGETRILYKLDNILKFVVHDAVEMRGNWHGKWPGTVRPPLEWRTHPVGVASSRESEPRALPITMEGSFPLHPHTRFGRQTVDSATARLEDGAT